MVNFNYKELAARWKHEPNRARLIYRNTDNILIYL